MKILVTGGAGFIGSNVVDNYIQMGHEVTIIDNLSRGKEENINPKAKFINMDITDPKLPEVFAEGEFNLVNHHAAMINVRESVDKPIEYENNNTLGLVNLLKNCANYKVKKIINVSSGGVVYGNPEKLPPKEDVAFNPLSPYALTKVCGEYWVNYYNNQFGLEYTNLRYANIYGPRQSTEGGAGVIAIFAKMMLKNEQPVIYGDGNIGRDYVYVSDIAQINALCIENGTNESFNVGTGRSTTVNEIFELVKKSTAYQDTAKHEDEKPGEVKDNYLDASRAKEILGWEPKVTLEEGIAKTVEYFKTL